MKRLFLLIPLLLGTHLLFAQQFDTLSEYFVRGERHEDAVVLYSNENYNALRQWQKKEVINQLPNKTVVKIITVINSEQGREMWVLDEGNYRLLEVWDNNQLNIDSFRPLTINSYGESRLYYSLGGAFFGNSTKYVFSGNARIGTFLYKNFLDVSAIATLGGSIGKEESSFNLSIAAHSRAYLPFKIKTINLSPYVGAGASWTILPSSFFEFQALSGVCWFVGPGRLDLGLQYGIKSKFAATIGFTFTPSPKKR